MMFSRNLRLSFFSVSLLLLTSCHPEQKAVKEQETYSYSIEAEIKNCEDCDVEFAYWDYTKHHKLEKTKVKNGHFKLKGEVKQPGFYYVHFTDFHLPTKNKEEKETSGRIVIYLPADSIHLTIDPKEPISTKFYRHPYATSHLKYTLVESSSPKQKELEQFLLLTDSMMQKFYIDKSLVVAKLSQTYESEDKALMNQWADSVNSFEYKGSAYLAQAADLFVQQHPESEAALYAMLENRNDRPAVERFRQYYNAMPASLQESFYGKALDRELAKMEDLNRNNQRFIGSLVKELNGKTPAGEKLDAVKIFNQNKLTLVEFWASWCGPCRMELPKYRKLYQDYNSKGFDMIAVSMDTNHEKWVKAIAEDSLSTLHHLSELKGGYGEDIKRFNIRGIPANLLMNGAGKIVAVDITTADLKKKLQQSL